MRARAFFKTQKLMLPGVVIGATFRTGFTSTLANWRLVIDDEGNLFQDSDIFWEFGRAERRQEQVHIGADAVIQLLLKAEELGFQRFEPSRGCTMDGSPSYLITIRFGDLDKTVEANSATWPCTYPGDMNGERFFELWKAIHQYAPFKKKL